MKITGDTFRSILSVGRYSFSKKMKFSDTSSTYKIGFSGDADSLSFLFENGKVYDPEGRLVYTFNDLNTVTLSGNVETGSYQYYINNNLICSNGQKSDFLSNKLFYEVDSGSSVTVNDFYIKTDADLLDDLSISFIDDRYFISGNITGNIVNGGNINSTNKIFTGTVAADSVFSFASNFPFEVSPSGQFILTNIGGTAESYNTTLRFTTATGTITRDITLYKKASNAGLDYVYGSGVGLVTNTIGSVKEKLNLISLVEFTDVSGNRLFEFNVEYTRNSGVSNTAIAKDVSLVLSVDTGLYDYGSFINTFVTSGISGLNIFDTTSMSAFDSATQTLTGAATLSSGNNNFFFSFVNRSGTQEFNPYIYYQISGESTAITGLVSGVLNA